MTIATMRLIDRFAGIPLCWIAGIVRRFPRNLVHPPRSVLIIKFFGLGSILLTSPALSALKKKYPDAKIIYLSFSKNSEILKELSSIDERWVIDSDSIFSFLSSFLAVVRRLTLRRIDVVLDFEFFSKFSTFMGALANPQMQIGFSLPTRWRRSNLSHSVVLASDRHVTESFFSMLGPLGIQRSDVPHPRISLHSSGGDMHLPVAMRFWDSDIICVNPNASETSLDRRWDARRYAQALEILLNDYPDALFCLIGSVSEREYVQSVADHFQSGNSRVVNLAGRTSLRGLVELFARSCVLITNDSGPMHLAAAVGLPTVALFGPESPVFYSPLGNQTINLYANRECSPCLNTYDAKVFRCPIDGKCMKDIPVDWVVDGTRTLLRSVKAQDLVEHVSL